MTLPFRSTAEGSVLYTLQVRMCELQAAVGAPPGMVPVVCDLLAFAAKRMLKLVCGKER